MDFLPLNNLQNRNFIFWIVWLLLKWKKYKTFSKIKITFLQVYSTIHRKIKLNQFFFIMNDLILNYQISGGFYNERRLFILYNNL